MSIFDEERKRMGIQRTGSKQSSGRSSGSIFDEERRRNATLEPNAYSNDRLRKELEQTIKDRKSSAVDDQSLRKEQVSMFQEERERIAALNVPEVDNYQEAPDRTLQDEKVLTIKRDRTRAPALNVPEPEKKTTWLDVQANMAEGFYDSVGFGMLQEAQRRINNLLIAQGKMTVEEAEEIEAQRDRREDAASYKVGKFAGYVPPGVAIERGVGAVAKPIVQNLPRWQRYAATGAAAGGLEALVQEGADVAFREDTFDPLNILLGTAAGGALGAAAPVVGDKVKAGFDAVRDRVAFRQAARDYIERINSTPADLTAANTGPRAVRQIEGSPESRVQGDEAAAVYRRGEGFDAEYQKAIEDQYQFLKRSMADRGGVEQGGLIRDEVTGDVTGRYGRISNNPRWYQEFYAENGRAPTDKDLRELARKHVNEGFNDDSGRIPPWRPRQMEEIDNEIASVRETAAALSKSSTESTNLDDLVRQRGYSVVTPETIAQTYNTKKWYHGTGTDTLTAETLDPFVGSHESLFGQGVYLTDSPNIAEGYAKNRGKRRTPTVYEAEVDVDRVLDLEKPITEDVAEAIAKSVEPLDYRYEQEIGEPGFFTNMIASEIARDGATPEQVITKIREAVRDFSREAEIPTSDFVEDFQYLAINLKQAGYDGLTHTGGHRTGNDPHRVLILLDPQNWHGDRAGKRQVTRFGRYNPPVDDTPSALKEVETTLQSERSRMKRQLPPESQALQQAPEGVQAMNAAPIPLRASTPGAKVKPITRKNLIGNIRKRFGVTIRTGRLGKGMPKGVLGIHKVTPEVIRSRYANDIQIIAHELGHNLDKRYGLNHPIYMPELINLVQNAGVVNTAAYQPAQLADEGIAEFIRLYLTDPAKAQQLAPRYSKFFETRAKEILPALRETQADVARWIDQGEAMRVRGKINRTGKNTDATLTKKIDQLYADLVNKFHILGVAEKDITGGIGDATVSLSKKARLSVGAPRIAMQVLEDFKKVLKPLDKIGASMADLGDYAAMKHADDLERLGIESGFERSEIDAAIAKFGTPEMEAVRQSLMAYNNRLLDMLVEGQVYSQEAIDAMRAKYPNYVPFYRYFDEDMGAVGFGSGGKGFTDLTSPFKRLKGSTRDVIDPLESMIRNTFAVVNAVQRNKVGLELARLSKFDGAGKWVERLDGKQKVANEKIVTVFENGERVQYQLDPELYRAMKQLDEESLSNLVKVLSYPASWLRQGATLTPEFMLRNPIRDQFQAFVVSEFGYNPIIDLPRGLFSVVKKRIFGQDPDYDAWVREGGAFGGYLSLDRDYLREQLQAVRDERHWLNKATVGVANPKQWLRVLQGFSELTEEATKVGEFKRGIRKGATPAEAAFQARDLMDFGRVGSDLRNWNRVIAFLNANIQGKDRLARAFKNNWKRTTLRALTGVTLPTIGVYLANKQYANEKQQETLNNAPHWLRDSFFLLAIPGTDVVARIPKPFDLAPVFANLPENILRHIEKSDPQTFLEFMVSTIRNSSLPYMISGLTPWIENMTNYRFFTGGPVVPQRDQDVLPEDQYGPTTSLTARLIGKGTAEASEFLYNLFGEDNRTGISPYKVDNLIQGYTAGLGRYATKGIDEILELLGAGKLPPEPSSNWSELPVINAFTVDTTGGGKAMDDFYETLERLSTRADSNEQNNVDDDLIADLARMMNRTQRKISSLRTDYREVQNSYDLTPEQKRRQLDELNELMIELARSAVTKAEAQRAR